MRSSNADKFIHHRIHNTVVKKKSVTIHYPHHPRYRKFLPVLEVWDKANPPTFVGQITDTVTLTIPQWMTLPEAEALYPVRESPLVFVKSLLETADYLTNQQDANKNPSSG